ncbi:hypothetical protein BJY59DRAFT_549955 [Rhodotorula toruloides]
MRCARPPHNPRVCVSARRGTSSQGCVQARQRASVMKVQTGDFAPRGDEEIVRFIPLLLLLSLQPAASHCLREALPAPASSAAGPASSPSCVCAHRGKTPAADETCRRIQCAAAGTRWTKPATPLRPAGEAVCRKEGGEEGEQSHNRIWQRGGAVTARRVSALALQGSTTNIEALARETDGARRSRARASGGCSVACLPPSTGVSVRLRFSTEDC